MDNLKPQPHAALIKLWADGHEIEFKNELSCWCSANNPRWDINTMYRLKPTPKPDTEKFINLYDDRAGVNESLLAARANACADRIGILKVTLDGETGKLKAVEIL